MTNTEHDGRNDETIDGCTLRTQFDPESGNTTFVLFGPSGWRVGNYKSRAAAVKRAAKVGNEVTNIYADLGNNWYALAVEGIAAKDAIVRRKELEDAGLGPHVVCHTMPGRKP